MLRLIFNECVENLDSDGIIVTHFRTHIFSLDNIPILEDRGVLINQDDLIRKKFLVKGSNSVLHTAKIRAQKVVIKQVRANNVDNAISEREFQIEHEILSRIKYVISLPSALFSSISIFLHKCCSHAHIVKYLGGGYATTESGVKRFLVLECLSSSTLLALLCESQNGPLSYRKVLDISVSLMDAIKFLHHDFHPDAVIIHRDLKPVSVLIIIYISLFIIFSGNVHNMMRRRTILDLRIGEC